MYSHLNALQLSLSVHQRCSVTFKMHQIHIRPGLRHIIMLGSSSHSLCIYDKNLVVYFLDHSVCCSSSYNVKTYVYIVWTEWLITFLTIMNWHGKTWWSKTSSDIVKISRKREAHWRRKMKRDVLYILVGIQAFSVLLLINVTKLHDCF